MKTIAYLAILLILSSAALAGVTNPLPTELNLKPGESGRFKFQIQTVASNQELNCRYYLTEASVLSVKFDPAEIVVPAGTVREVYGTVKASRSLDYGAYAEKFCISCFPTSSPSGAAVAVETCDLPIKVNVVEERAKDNMYVPPKPFSAVLLLIVVLGIVTAGVIGYSYLRHKKEQNRKIVLKGKKRR